MSHSSDYINNLPTELLTRVFDSLDFEQLLEASTVCTRWFEILSGKRYIARHRLFLCPKLLDEENFDNLRRFRSVKIRAKYFTNHMPRLKQYLCNSEAVQMLEELDLKCDATIWNNIFETGNELNLPNLHTLRFFVPMDPNTGQTPCRIVALKLKTFHQQSNTICGPLELFKDQIETLVVDFREIGHFLSTALGLSFENLRSLTLNTLYGPWSSFSVSDIDFHPGYETIFNKLDRLKINDICKSFSAVYDLIIREAKNLKSLEIHGDMIYQDSFSEINQLKQLTELVLMVSIAFPAPPNGLSLQNLTKLTTFIESLAPLASVPNLKSLTIANREGAYSVSHVLRSDVEVAQIRSLAHQLESLEIVNVELDDIAVDQICTWKDLRVLKMKDVAVEPTGLVRMLSALQNLKFARFIECRLIKRSENYDSDCCTADEFWKDVCIKLAEVNVNCTIVATGGQILEALRAISVNELLEKFGLS